MNVPNDQNTVYELIGNDTEAELLRAGSGNQVAPKVLLAAVALTLGETSTSPRCGPGDTDFFRVVVPPLNGVEVSVDGFQNAEEHVSVERALVGLVHDDGGVVLEVRVAEGLAEEHA